MMESKRGRPRKSVGVISGEKKPSTNKQVDKARRREKEGMKVVTKAKIDLNVAIANEFHQKLPEYVDRRKKEFLEVIERCHVQDDIIIDEKNGRVSHYVLSEMLSKPLIFQGIANSMITSHDICMLSDCYWDCANKLMDIDRSFIPTLSQLCRLMGISTATFSNYKNHRDTNIREAVLMAYDRFVSFYTEKGLTGELEKLTTIFTLKSQFGLRDNDPPQVVVNNTYNADVKTDIDDIEKKYNLYNDAPIIDVEV